MRDWKSQYNLIRLDNSSQSVATTGHWITDDRRPQSVCVHKLALFAFCAMGSLGAI